MKLFEVKECKYGRGIFATRNISKGELIHEAPIIISPSDEYKYLKKTIFIEYVFWWGENLEECALALGYGSLFNHSYTPNGLYKLNLTQKTIDFYAHTDIKEGEEIMINYNGDPENDTPVWFDVL
ncbi:SET domain-containing protein-lysine N-methyltransferase [Bacillus sp. AFS076308]|uniref:SET domain-containing protein n=1 Tax=unclassified Bacillus (in: firmicutes) TaxID=185979 RepID=UPI000BF3D5D8|nr:MULTISPECIES: SET domain-containing protein [unclassified Bacillus (in: firmicutes)]PFN98152.1 SET domain-containing protein-lysine N-methyltransferase [Bacillus sp. AFS076308]PGV50867.1 SET domain-containing protein-lysine N-methyltransferase [Bacillus sp. AFS037270]